MISDINVENFWSCAGKLKMEEVDKVKGEREMTSQLKTSLKKKIIKIKKIKIKTSLSDHPLGTISNPIP